MAEDGTPPEMTVREAQGEAARAISRWEAQAASLSGADRADFELQYDGLRADLAAIVAEEDTRARYAADLEGRWPPAAELRMPRGFWQDETTAQRMEDVFAIGAGMGLDVEEQRRRIEFGGTNTLGLAQDWIERDAATVMSGVGIDPPKASEAERSAAFEMIDYFNEAVAERMLELRLERSASADIVAFPTESMRGTGTGSLEDGGVELDEGDTTRLSNGAWFATLAAEARQTPHTRIAGFDRHHELEDRLEEEVGIAGIEALREGRTDVLAQAIPARFDRAAIAQEYVAELAERHGDAQLAARAANLQQERIDALVEEQIATGKDADLADPRNRGRDLDDGMELV